MGELPEGTLPGGTGPAHLRQQPGSLGRMGARFPCWLGSCDAPALSHSQAEHREGFCHQVLLLSTLLVPCTALRGRNGGASAVLQDFLTYSP